MKISVISSGSWGTSLAKVLCDNGHDTTLWGRSEEYVKEMQETGQNTRYLKGIDLPKNLKLSSDFRQSVEGTDLLILATPTQYVRNTFEDLKALEMALPPLVNVSKGIEVKSLKRISQICAEILGEKQDYAILAGPSHAEEVMKNIPTAVVAASSSEAVAQKIQDAFSNETNFRTYTTNDVTGVEIGGALKNVFAIAAGIIDGLKYGDNTKAALMTRGIVEMSRLGQALGGEADTFSGLSGIGDLIVTCTSQHSRNRFVGEKLGAGHSLEEITAMMNHSVAEGVKTTESAYELARKLGVETPIVNEVYAVIYEGKSAVMALNDLMNRQPKGEKE